MYALMGLTDATILALAMYPITYSEDWTGIYGNSKYKITYDEFNQKSEMLQKKFKIPIFMLGNIQHMNSLCQAVIDFF